MEKIKTFCCICMQKAEELLSLDKGDSHSVKYIEKLSFCVPQVIWVEYYQICNACICQLDGAHAFVQACIESELFRKELQLENSDTTDFDLSKNSKEVKYICDHCNRSFKQKKYLCQHITKLHIKNRSKEIIKKEEVEEITNEYFLEENESNDVKIEIEIKCVEEPTLIKLEQNKENQDNLSVVSDADVKTDLDDYVDNCSPYFEPEIDSKQPKQKSIKKTFHQCSFCPETFSKRQAWSAHIRTKHTIEKPFACDECDARYMNEYSLLIHKRKHTNEKPFICATCGKSFFSSADLNHHNKIHNADRAYSCPLCERSFKTHSNLRTHRLQMHLDPSEWKFLCDLCNKKFPIRGNLVKHLKRHSGIKEFDCHVCGKQFINKAELKLHLNTHTNQRNFECKWCAKDYKNREGLRRHLKVVHGEGNWKPPKADKRFLCPMCPKVFTFSNKLQRHIFTHTGEKPYKCDYCQKRFIDNYGRKVHCKKDHNLEVLV